MRARPVVLFALAALAVAGCGDRRLLLGVDALSFTAPSARVYAFGPVPVLPVPVASGEIPVLDDQHVNMFEGAGNIAAVEAVTITAGADIADSTGSGLDTLRVYMSDGATDPLMTAPVVVAPIVLTPGQSQPLHVVVAGDPRVIALFTQTQMRVTVTTSYRGSTSGQPLNGRVTLTQLRADVIATHRSF